MKNPSFNFNSDEFLKRAERLYLSYMNIERSIQNRQYTLQNLIQGQQKRRELLFKAREKLHILYDKNFRLLADTHKVVYAQREKKLNLLEERLLKVFNDR